MNEETNGSEKETVKGSAQCKEENEDDKQYEAEFELSRDFGKVGAILIENEQHKELFLKTIVLHGFPDGPLNLTCNSWIQPKQDSPAKRVFFTDKVIRIIIFIKIRFTLKLGQPSIHVIL
jgi:lipoxygenase